MNDPIFGKNKKLINYTYTFIFIFIPTDMSLNAIQFIAYQIFFRIDNLTIENMDNNPDILIICT